MHEQPADRHHTPARGVSCGCDFTGRDRAHHHYLLDLADLGEAMFEEPQPHFYGCPCLDCYDARRAAWQPRSRPHAPATHRVQTS